MKQTIAQKIIAELNDKNIVFDSQTELHNYLVDWDLIARQKAAGDYFYYFEDSFILEGVEDNNLYAGKYEMLPDHMRKEIPDLAKLKKQKAELEANRKRDKVFRG